MTDSPLVAEMRAMVREELARVMPKPKREVVGWRVKFHDGDYAVADHREHDGWSFNSKHAPAPEPRDVVTKRLRACRAWPGARTRGDWRLVRVTRPVRP